MTEIMITHRCPKCNHNSRVHQYDSTGKVRCPECPQEVCGMADTPDDQITNLLDFGELTTIGIKPINEMTDRELVEEIMHAQYVALTSSNFTSERKRRMVAEIRISSAKARIMREAGINPYNGLFGMG